MYRIWKQTRFTCPPANYKLLIKADNIRRLDDSSQLHNCAYLIMDACLLSSRLASRAPYVVKEQIILEEVCSIVQIEYVMHGVLMRCTYRAGQKSGP